MKFVLQLCSNKTATISSRIDALSPLKVIARGFTTVLKDDEYITDINKIDVDDIVSHFKTKNTQNFFRQCFGLFIKQKKELAINDELINEIRNRCKIQ